MQKIAILTTLSLFALALVAPISSAGHCNGVVTAVPLGPETYYLDDRSSAAGDINHWSYLESNGAEDLQSGGDNIVLEDNEFFIFSDPCGHAGPDTLLL